MRLYLSSHSIGPAAGQLVVLMGEAKRIGLIPNAGDAMAPFEREQRVAGYLDELAWLGLAPEVLDMAEYFDDPEGLSGRLDNLDGVWAFGGSCYLLAYALERAGAGKVLTPKVLDNSLVYGGSSAGACVAGRDLAAFSSCEDPRIVRATHGDEPTYQGLGILDKVVVPHYTDSPSPGQIKTPLVVKYAKEHGQEYVTISDQETLVTSGGECVRYLNGMAPLF
jgi:dipeptidase E